MGFLDSCFKYANMAFCTVIAWLMEILGGWDAALSMLLLMMGLDILTGVAVSFKKRSDHTTGGGFLSRALFEGLSRKLMIILMVILATALDGLLQTSIARVVVIGFYASNEAMSIIENAAIMGVPFPKGLLNALERLRSSHDAADVTDPGKNPAQ